MLSPVGCREKVTLPKNISGQKLLRTGIRRWKLIALRTVQGAIPRAHSRIMTAEPFQQRFLQATIIANAGKAARSAGLSRAPKLQMQPQKAHWPRRELWLSRSDRRSAKLITNADKQVSHNNHGITTTGGETAHAHPANRPADSPKCSLPSFRTTSAVSDEKITFRKSAAQADAVVCTPSRRKSPASRLGYRGANQAVGPVAE